jgi:5-methylcytosine-specific restriction protein B
MNWQQVIQVLDEHVARYVSDSGVEPKNGYATGYVLGNGRQLAVETKSDGVRTNVWVEDVGPPAVPSHFQLYKEDKTRISSLSSVAPRLTGPGYGKPPTRAYKVVITSLGELEALLNWYGEKKLSFQPKDAKSETQMPFGNSERKTMTLNTILYGPPGTGKTHKTAQLAVEICDGGTSSSDRNELMARYEELRKDGRISFVTFHQSYGYEDFVEGLRPEMNEGQVSYRVRQGVFREACDTARRNTLVKPGLSGMPLRERTIFKMSLGAAGTSEGRHVFQACIENGIVLLGWGDNIDFSECENSDEILKKATESNVFENPKVAAGYIDTFKHNVRVGDIIVASHGNRAFQAIGEVIDEYEFLEAPLAEHFHQKRAVRWLAVYEAKRPVEEIYDKNFSQSALYTLNHTGVRFDVLESLLKEQQSAINIPFVLIIDEINRANISKVFGELITLLEEGKREGNTNALTVKLPYSGDEFCVPANLYVIGTMNTADRSIALLDTALRRRFEFKELQPDVGALTDEPVEGVDLRRLLKAINERIEYLYDRDHTIGHAYFIGVQSLSELDVVFRRKVIPLLQEYFYENWSKVRAVLNDSVGDFIKAQDDIPAGLTAFVDGYDPKLRYRVNSEPFTQSAFAKIYE